MNIGFGKSRHGRVEWIKASLELVEERIESEDMVIYNIDNSFNKFCQERKKTNGR